jgi:hypothetical protein
VGEILDLLLGADQLDATGLAAAAGVDLGLDHPALAADLGGRLDGLLGRARGVAVRYGQPVLPEELLGLVFVQIHTGSPPVDKCYRRINEHYTHFGQPRYSGVRT